MTAPSQFLFALSRAQAEKFMMDVVANLDDNTLKNSIYMLMINYAPNMLQKLIDSEMDHSEEKAESSAQEETQEETHQEETQCTPYVPPPRVRDADRYWPYMRCKNVARALMPYNYDFKAAPLPRSHHALLEFIANKANMSVELLKKTNPKNIFRNNLEVDKVLGYTFY